MGGLTPGQALQYGQMARRAYDAPELVAGLNDVGNYQLIDQDASLVNGYNGAAFYNADNNTLVVASGGSQEVMDFVQDSFLELRTELR